MSNSTSYKKYASGGSGVSGGQVGVAGKGQRGKRSGGGCKGQRAKVGGGGGESLTDSFCNLRKFRCINQVGHELALQNFRITLLINTENLATFCTTRIEIKVEKVHVKWITIVNCFRIWFFIPFGCLISTWELILLINLSKIFINDLFSLFLGAGISLIFF